MSWSEALFLGAIQGVTEFLPISSDGHLAIIEHALAARRGSVVNGAESLFFNVMLHLGTLSAILVYYRHVGLRAARGLLDPRDPAPEFQRPALIRAGLLAAVATLPAVVVGLFLKDYVEQATASPLMAGAGFLVTATALLLTLRLKGGEKGLDQTTWLDAILIGTAQAIAILPGVSRSGMTIAAALGLGFTRPWAVGFSLLMAVPAISGAVMLELKGLDPATITPLEGAQTLAATVVAGVVGYLAVIWLIRIVRAGRLWYFSVYLIVLASVVFLFFPTRGAEPMLGERRRLWTGPFGSVLDRPALEEWAEEPGLWLVPSEPARDQVIDAVTRRRGIVTDSLRVWTWERLWDEVAATAPLAPSRLPPAGVRAVLGEAIDRARRAGALIVLGELADRSGFRRRLRARIAAWTRAECDPQKAPPRGPTEVDRAEWAIFRAYRARLKALQAEDAEGFAAWASRALQRDRSGNRLPLGLVVVLDLPDADRAVWRAIEAFHQRADVVGVALHWDGQQPEPFSTVAPWRERLLRLGFTETAVGPDPVRPEALGAIERELFRTDPLPCPELTRTAGLAILGAPRGEGLAMALARRVWDLLEGGAEPGEILVLFPQWDDQAEMVLEMLCTWGLPVATDAARTLTTDPAIAALLLALRLPLDRWEAGRLMRLLRHGQVRPAWPEVRTPLDLAVAATAIGETRVFRDREAIRSALKHDANPSGDPAPSDDERRRREQKAARAKVALPIVERLIRVLDPLARPGRWSEHVARLDAVRAELRLGEASEGALPYALEHLRNALDDHSDVLTGLGRGGESLFHAEFAREVEALVRELDVRAAHWPPGVIRLTTLEQAEGVRRPHVVLANLAEGTFPARDAVETDPELGWDDAEETGTPNPTFAREMLRFLRVVGAAGRSLTLAFPTTDEKGQALLAAGFLDDVRRLFDPGALTACTVESKRLDPVLDPEHCGAPRERRVRAVALACQAKVPTDFDELRELARQPHHRPVLDRVAAVLRVAHRRLRRKEFGPFDGRLHDPQAVTRLQIVYGADRPIFSPSHLESYAFCPFQFFLRYVLRLEPTDDRDEFDEDYTARGSLIHRVLQDLHELLNAVPPENGETLPERVKAHIEPILTDLLVGDALPASDVDAGRRTIDAERLKRTARRYADQFASYYSLQAGTAAECHRFEVAFGSNADGSEPHPPLLVGSNGEAIQVQGKIDRIDLVRLDGGATLFRVIDYKTGHSPGKADVTAGVALQLPLYALAVERIILADVGASPLDVGYWALAGKGYKAVQQMAKLRDGGAVPIATWAAFRAATEAYVLDLVRHIRAGDFPIRPHTDACMRPCEFRAVCRITQVRRSGKAWPDAPALRLEDGP